MQLKTEISDDLIKITLEPVDVTDELIRQALQGAQTATIEHNGGITFCVPRPQQKLGKFSRETDKKSGGTINAG